MKDPCAAAVCVAGVMALQAVLGLLWPDYYRDQEWIRATWLGNDAVTLIVAAPLLIVSGIGAARGSARALLLTLGLTAYAVYNYAFYLFGAALNVFLPIYVLLLVSAVATLIGFSRLLNVGAFAYESWPRLTRLAGVYFTAVALGLASAWLWRWGAYVFLGRATPLAPEQFKLIVALDLSIMVPLLLTGGVLLLRRRPHGVPISAVGGVLASMYLLVLSVNAAIAIRQGFTPPPGELPLWSTLFVLTALATTVVVCQRAPTLNSKPVYCISSQV